MVAQVYQLLPAQIAAAADMIVAARRSGTLIHALPQDLTPVTLADGYSVQDEVRRRWSDRVAGWKAGATAAAVQQRFALSEPFAGPFFAGDVAESLARLPAARFAHLAIESEFAFRFDQPLAPRAGRYGRDEIVAAIDAVMPAFEIVSPRFPDFLFDRAPLAVADCGLNAAFVFGEITTDWRDLDFASHTVVLDVAGTERARGTGAAVLGNPLNVLDWAVNHLSERGIAIEAGQIISTGTTTGIIHLAPGETARADFGALGMVELRFDGAAHPEAVRPAT